VETVASDALSASEALSAGAGLTLNNVLAIAAAVLLVFVSGGVIYLSTIEWRDRRRRQQPVQAATKARR
jgi:hypothetical protein